MNRLLLKAFPLHAELRKFQETLFIRISEKESALKPSVDIIYSVFEDWKLSDSPTGSSK